MLQLCLHCETVLADAQAAHCSGPGAHAVLQDLLAGEVIQPTLGPLQIKWLGLMLTRVDMTNWRSPLLVDCCLLGAGHPVEA